MSSLVSAGIVGQTALLAITPLITRLYTPADFGIAAVFSALMSTLLMVIHLRYEMAIVLPRFDRQAAVLVRLALTLTITSAAIVLLVVALWREPIARILHVPLLAGLLWLLPVALVAAGFYRVFNFWAVRREAFRLISRTRIRQPLANAATQIAGGIFHPSALGLATGQVVGLVVGGRSLARGVSVWVRPSRTEWRKFKAVARRYIRFPMFDLPAAFVDALGVQLPNLLLALLFGSTVAGWYILSSRVILLPLSLISQAIGQVIYARSRRYIDQKNMAQFIVKVSIILFSVIICIGIVFVPSAPILFKYIFGQEWERSGLYSAILFFAFASQFVYSSISLSLPASNGQHVSLIINGALLISKAAALYYGYHCDSAMLSIIYFSLVTFIGNIISILIVIIHLKSHSSNSIFRVH